MNGFMLKLYIWEGDERGLRCKFPSPTEQPHGLGMETGGLFGHPPSTLYIIYQLTLRLHTALLENLSELSWHILNMLDKPRRVHFIL